MRSYWKTALHESTNALSVLGNVHPSGWWLSRRRQFRLGADLGENLAAIENHSIVLPYRWAVNMKTLAAY
jgi:hypothetical protein